MPTDSNGNFSLVPGYLAVSGATIQPSQHNPPLEDIAAALSARVPRNGSAPMTAPLKFVDGTAAAPGMAFASNPGTGFFKSASGVGLAVGGVKVGELTFQLPIGLGPLPWSGATAPAGWVLCYGQALLRASYPDLWTYVQAEIAAANTLYNNGNGTTTFGIPDWRGRVSAGADNMGGVAANRLPGFSIWALGGAATLAIAQANLPNVNFPVTDPGHVHGPGGGSLQYLGTIGTPNVNLFQSGANNFNRNDFTGSAFTGISVNSGGSGTPISNVQPTGALNHILFAGA